MRTRDELHASCQKIVDLLDRFAKKQTLAGDIYRDYLLLYEENERRKREIETFQKLFNQSKNSPGYFIDRFGREHR